MAKKTSKVTVKKLAKREPKKLVIRNKNQYEAGRRWQDQSPEDAAKTIGANLEYFILHQTWRENQYRRFGKLYMNLPLYSVMGTASQGRHSTSWSADRLTFNVAQSCVDTLTSTIPTKKISPRFITTGGDYKAQSLAEDLQMFADGVRQECETDQKGKFAFRDAAIYADGFIHTYSKFGRICQDLVHCMEIWVDESESHLAKPTQMIRAKPVDRDELIAEFPNKKDVIMQAKRIEDRDATGPQLSDLVMRLEAWKLPSAPGKDDGANIVCVDGMPLTDLKVWTRMNFPVRKFTFSESPASYYGQGLIEQIEGIQREINQLLWGVKEALRQGMGFKWWVKSGGKVVIDHISNQIGAILRSEEKPEDMMAHLIQPEVYQRIAQCIQDAYQQSGISQLAASSVKPEDLESGEALRAMNDISTARFMSLGQDYEAFQVGLTKDIIETMQEMEEETGTSDYEVTVPNEQSLSRINWKNIRWQSKGKDKPGVDEFRVKCLPQSALPNDISGKLQSIQDMAQAGLELDADDVFALLDFPDLKRVQNLTTAERKWIVKRLDAIVDDGEYTPPDGYDNLPLAIRIGKQYLATAHDQELPEPKVIMLQKWINACTKEAKMQMAAAAPPPPTAPVLPAKAATPPVNNMIQPPQQPQA